jgi:hypothetical protein
MAPARKRASSRKSHDGHAAAADLRVCRDQLQRQLGIEDVRGDVGESRRARIDRGLDPASREAVHDNDRDTP